MRTRYYTLTGTVTPGWLLPHPRTLKVTRDELKGGIGSRPVNPHKWPDEPHVALANLGYPQLADDENIKWFTSIYGSLALAPEGIGDAGEPFWLNLAAFRLSQKLLREAWEKRDAAVFADPSGIAKGQGFDWLPVDWKARGTKLEIRPASLHAYVCILLARDLANGCVKICKRPGCPHPYFIATRSDAKYCSHLCAVAVNVRNFRRRHQKARRRKR